MSEHAPPTHDANGLARTARRANTDPIELHATIAMWEGSVLTLYESTQGVVNHRGELDAGMVLLMQPYDSLTQRAEVLHAALPEMAELAMRPYIVRTTRNCALPLIIRA